MLGVLAVTATGCDLILSLERNYPNYYGCDCQCSRRVTAILGATQLALPGSGSVVDSVPPNSVGTILDGPVNVDDQNGNPVTWWQVEFDGRPPLPAGQGWVTQATLTPANETSVSKTAKACLPASLNENVGGSTPTIDNLKNYCATDVAHAAQGTVNEILQDAGKYLCQCGAQSLEFSRNYDETCNAPCTDPSGVCLVAGSDPPDPSPDPISAALFKPVSTCDVTGSVDITVDDHEPKDQPMAQGNLRILGRPCTPGEECVVGMSYQLTSDDIEFDSGTVFASDPKFVELSLSGATQPEVIDMGTGPVLGFYLGEVEAGTAFTSGHGRRSGSSDAFGVSGLNTAGLALAMNWDNKVCRIAGQLVGKATKDDDAKDLDATVDVVLEGDIVNQPPHPDAGPDQVVECTSPTGAFVTLDGSGSTDPDDNISFYVWRFGSATGAPVAEASADPTTETQQELGTKTYDLQVVDGLFAADHASVMVTVADNTAPQIYCNAPATIVPSDVPEKRTEGISFTASAEDSCTGVANVTIQSFTCTKPSSCRVQFQGDTITILDSGGVGDTIQWTVSSQDRAGNAGQTICQLNVVKKTK